MNSPLREMATVRILTLRKILERNQDFVELERLQIFIQEHERISAQINKESK